MMSLNFGISRKRQAVVLSPLQLAWRKTWKHRVRACVRRIGIGLGALLMFLVGWAFFIIGFSF